jgi:hypothetical protein
MDNKQEALKWATDYSKVYGLEWEVEQEYEQNIKHLDPATATRQDYYWAAMQALSEWDL